ncbi:hypothetical protein LY78DRAFT_263884 [Colletotrichum sublineola]|nr:hypothetical protein LY78DRAFT_263884 [Colletotrichum sublineola]
MVFLTWPSPHRLFPSSRPEHWRRLGQEARARTKPPPSAREKSKLINGPGLREQEGTDWARERLAHESPRLHRRPWRLGVRETIPRAIELGRASLASLGNTSRTGDLRTSFSGCHELYFLSPPQDGRRVMCFCGLAWQRDVRGFEEEFHCETHEESGI